MRSKFSNSKKIHIVLEGVRSGHIKELCSSYGINQVTYYKWRDKVLKSGDKFFFDEAKKDIEKIICKYNTNYPHSAIGYQTPYDFDLMSKKRNFPQKIKQKKKKKLV